MIAVGAVLAVAVVGGIVWTQRSQPAVEVVQAPISVPVPAPAPAAPVEPVPVDETLTNDGIIQMVKAKVPIEVIYSQLRTAPNKFNLSATDVIRLTNEGVPLTVIEGMRNPKSIPVAKVAAAAPAATKGNEKAVTAPVTAASPAAPATAPSPVAIPAPAAPVEVATSRPAPATAGGRQVVLPDGSPFAIALAADIPDNVKEGAQLHFTVVSDVHVADALVIAKGAAATGEITQVKGRLMGKMQLRLLTVAGVDGKQYKIRALSSRTQKVQERPVDTGVKPKAEKSASDAGTQYIAYADGDMLVTVRGR